VPIHAIAMRWLRQFDAVKLEVLSPPTGNASEKTKGPV